MVRWPWSRDHDDDALADPRDDVDAEPELVCAFQDGTLYVYPDHVYIARAGPSKFDDKAIARSEITDVTYSSGSISYLQLEQVDFENDGGGLLSAPVDANTLHFGRGGRDCAKRAREELLFGSQPP
ncbi:MAG: hypothetical protein U5J98_05870 [Halobacteriales archaeon]|nr:hypothetical protein [Halobacteriales archaeon]